jgi:hypothetical protein
VPCYSPSATQRTTCYGSQLPHPIAHFGHAVLHNDSRSIKCTDNSNRITIADAQQVRFDYLKFIYRFRPRSGFMLDENDFITEQNDYIDFIIFH